MLVLLVLRRDPTYAPESLDSFFSFFEGRKSLSLCVRVCNCEEKTGFPADGNTFSTMNRNQSRAYAICVDRGRQSSASSRGPVGVGGGEEGFKIEKGRCLWLRPA